MTWSNFCIRPCLLAFNFQNSLRLLTDLNWELCAVDDFFSASSIDSSSSRFALLPELQPHSQMYSLVSWSILVSLGIVYIFSSFFHFCLQCLSPNYGLVSFRHYIWFYRFNHMVSLNNKITQQFYLVALSHFHCYKIKAIYTYVSSNLLQIFLCSYSVQFCCAVSHGAHLPSLPKKWNIIVFIFHILSLSEHPAYWCSSLQFIKKNFKFCW